ncbi:hypothetical protein U6A24_01140 [Aquimarina gracilis]|uniref:START domain-containing protein n=1 Tax=Aquimarina gracilis TaxID=874422 RepID=A0ABU5ZR39_9FLAO|nr:hypothetical protein [Aquimarina gracilis]MEB3344042.1 hypothetical protein [Aquimarina gracilis]
MKKLLLLLFLFPLTVFAQTDYSQEDIEAAATHDKQWLLTNTTGDQVDYTYGIIKMVQPFIQNQTKWEAKAIACKTNCLQWIHQSNTPGNLKKRKISYTLYYDQLPTGKRISTKVVFEGNKDLVVDFFMNYWTEDLEFNTGQKGKDYLATVRFLTDIAVLQINDDGDASITVTTGTAKDAYATMISQN